MTHFAARKTYRKVQCGDKIQSVLHTMNYRKVTCEACLQALYDYRMRDLTKLAVHLESRHEKTTT